MSRDPSLSAPPVPAPPALNAPTSLTDLFVSFTLLALQGFGGVLAVVQRELVEKKRWMSRDEFVEDWAVAQILPGPNVVNLAMMIGGRYFGLRGALVSLAGILACPLVLVLVLAWLYSGLAGNVAMQGALRGMGAVAGGLITATGLKLIGALNNNVMGRQVCWLISALTFAAIALLHLPLAAVLLTLGVAACVWAYTRLPASVRRPPDSGITAGTAAEKPPGKSPGEGA